MSTDLRACSAAVMELLSLLTQQERFGVSDDEPHTLPARIRSMLDAALYTPITLDDLAAKLHLTPTHIIRVFRSAFGETPKKYLAARRLSQAKILLRETEISVREIAESLCYADSRHFASAFRAAVGQTPGEYRRSRSK